MTYEEACEAHFSRAEVVAELKRHSANIEEFFAEIGEHSQYPGKLVLDWLGY